MCVFLHVGGVFVFVFDYCVMLFVYLFYIVYVCVCVCVCVFGGGETVRQKDTGKKDTSFVL